MSTENNSAIDGLSRRKFIQQSAIAAGAGVLLAEPLISNAAGFIKPADNLTVGQIMDLFIKSVPGGVKTETVDTLKSGNRDIAVTGIVTTMFATVDIIRKAIKLGANFIIAHEPTFYNHADDTAWLQGDEVYQYKADLLKQHNIAVWRNHDYIHSLKPDGVILGVLKQLEWLENADKDNLNLLTFPSTPLRELVSHSKQKLDIRELRYLGDLNSTCRRIMILPGAVGVKTHIEAISKYKPNAIFCGEISEWETAEYVRDARAKGDNISLIVWGHIASEEPGSEFMLEWLNKNVPSIKAHHISPGNSLSFY